MAEPGRLVRANDWQRRAERPEAKTHAKEAAASREDRNRGEREQNARHRLLISVDGSE
jgi:hypothetical protein